MIALTSTLYLHKIEKVLMSFNYSIALQFDHGSYGIIVFIL